MTPWLSYPALMGLLVVSAIGYAAATAGIKFASAGHSLPAFALMIGGFGLAAAAEVVLLRQSNLATVYLTIIGLELCWFSGSPSGWATGRAGHRWPAG